MNGRTVGQPNHDVQAPVATKVYFSTLRSKEPVYDKGPCVTGFYVKKEDQERCEHRGSGHSWSLSFSPMQS